ncbi:MAG: metal ABC transporter substrate-binding protein [Peptococcaceae bacterium]|nr:metal ABC transporter substrate-binding protein [Peptococcaceae bacterium]
MLVLAAGLAMAGCSGGGNRDAAATATPGQKLKVVTTIYPLYDFTRNVGGDRIEVKCLVPPGSEPHEWEPSPRDLAELQKAGVFIYCGAGMESWAGKTLQAVASPKLVAVDCSRGIDLISGDEEGGRPGQGGAEHQPAFPHDSKDEPGCAVESKEDHGHGAGTDPHIWVDPLNAMKMVDNIAAGLSQADPANRAYYEANAAEYRKKLKALHEEYKNGLAGATRKEFVTSHAAFGYLARRYGLVQVPIRGLSPEVEPTPTRMAEVVKLAREKKIRYIFFESLVSPKVSQIIAAEAGAETLVLNPVGGLTRDEMTAGKDYLSVMRENLANLQKALEVKP